MDTESLFVVLRSWRLFVENGKYERELAAWKYAAGRASVLRQQFRKYLKQKISGEGLPSGGSIEEPIHFCFEESTKTQFEVRGANLRVLELEGEVARLRKQIAKICDARRHVFGHHGISSKRSDEETRYVSQ